MTARALTARPARFFLGAGSTALALCLGGAPLALSGTAHAAANNAKGSLTVHNEGTDITDENNEPHVCAFRLVADNYDPADTGITYSFSRIAPSDPQADGLLPGTITLVAGEGQTDVLSLPNGHYKPHGQLVGTENGADNFKAFWVDCQDSGGTTGGTTGDTTGGATTGESTTGESTTGESTTGESTTGESTTGESTTGESTTGESTTGESTTGESSTGGGTTGGEQTTGEITGGGTGATVVPVVTPSKPTLGGGHVKTPAVKTPATLPFTGSNTGTLALWGLASLIGGVGFCSLGQRKGASVR